MSEVVVDSVDADGSRIQASVSHSPELRRFFTGEDFFVEYDVDVSGVPEGVLAVPVLAQVCPVAWALGADVRVPVADRRFLDCLPAVGAALHEMYPSFVEGGRVIAGRATDPPSDDGDTGVGLLFTGGVDSLATYARHRNEDPTLINVRGWLVGIDEDERWAHAKERVESYGRRFDAETTFVRSNMLSFLETPMLSAHFSDRHDGGWYSAVGGGLGMLGLCAPLAAARNVESLYMGATTWEGMAVPAVVDHWDGHGMPWSTHPDVVDSVECGATRCVLDGFRLTRQDRVDIVADLVRSEYPDLPVRACEDSDTAGNCNRCEKCFRTALGLAIEGIDPNRHGFDLDRASFEYAREELLGEGWLVDEHHESYWQDLQLHAIADREYPIDGVAEFADWLRDVDFDGASTGRTGDRTVRTVARHTPYPVYSRLYPAYAALKRRVGE